MNILFVDLSRKTWRVETADPSLEKGYIGGRGVNQRLLWDLTDPAQDVLCPESPVILGSGPFVGTLVPAASRLAVDFRNTLNKGIGSANAGGAFAAAMRYAGYDHTVITGRSDSPVAIVLSSEGVKFRNATDLTGKSPWETEHILQNTEGPGPVRTLAAGPAGERGVRLACLISDRGRAAGYGGPGALFGSKNLKAVAVVTGDRPLIPFDGPRFLELCDKSHQRLMNSRFARVHSAGGTLAAYLASGDRRAHGVRNMSDEYWPQEAIDSVSEKTILSRRIRRHSCLGCPVGCSGLYRTGETPFEGLQANMYRAFATNTDVRDPEALMRANALANDMGLDCDHTSAAVAWAMECYEKGILDAKETGGLELHWGNGNAMVELIGLIGERKGFGELFADGVVEAARRVGRGSEQLVPEVRGNALMEAGMRSHPAWALGIVTSAKAGGHLRGAPAQEYQMEAGLVSRETASRLFGIRDPDNLSHADRARLVVWQERYKAVIDCMGICCLSSVWMDVELFQPDEIAELYTALTGTETYGKDLMETGERIVQMERAYNEGFAGFDRYNDTPPEKLLEPVSAGRYEGAAIDADSWQIMLEEYYRLHGWNNETGNPDAETLRAELPEIVKPLGARR